MSIKCNAIEVKVVLVTQKIFNIGLTHLGLEASIYSYISSLDKSVQIDYSYNKPMLKTSQNLNIQLK